MKRVGILLLQLLVTAAGLWYVFHDPQKRAQIAVALKHADRIWLILGWLCYSVVEILATVRWQILLRIQGPGGPYKFTVPGRHTKHLRFNSFKEPEKVPLVSG